MVAGALCFIPWPSAPDIAKNILFVAGYIIWDAFYTVANVPYGSLLSLISSDPGDRAALSTWRSIGSLLGNIATMVLIPLLIYDANQNIIGTRVFFVALIMGVIGFAAFQFMIRNTVERVEAEPPAKAESRSSTCSRPWATSSKTAPPSARRSRPWACSSACRARPRP